MYYRLVSEIYIDRFFLKNDCYSQQVISAVAREFLIPYNVTKRVPETQKSLNTVTTNTTPNETKQM